MPGDGQLININIFTTNKKHSHLKEKKKKLTGGGNLKNNGGNKEKKNTKNGCNNSIEFNKESDVPFHVPRVQILTRHTSKHKRHTVEKDKKKSHTPTGGKNDKHMKNKQVKIVSKLPLNLKTCEPIFNNNKDRVKTPSKSSVCYNRVKTTQSAPPCMNKVENNTISIEGLSTESKGSFKKMAETFTNSILDKEINGLKNEFENNFPNCIIPSDLICKESKIYDKKNINQGVPLLENSRVIIKNASKEDSYINANYITSNNKKCRLIITQHPMINTVNDFFNMILQENIMYIIQLAKENELEDPSVGIKYIPNNGSFQFKNVTVNYIKNIEYDKNSSIKITLINCKCNGKELNIEHILWKDWPNKSYPKSWDMTAINIYEYVAKSSKPILIHCTSGVRRSGIVSGIFLALDDFNSYKLKDNMIDIVKNLRNQRSYCIRTPTEYLFLHLQMIHYFLSKNYIENTQRLMEFLDDYDPAYKKQLDVEKNKTNISAYGLTTLKLSLPNIHPKSQN
uniref:Tyrosine phosphatase n=2 Tax=Strongyloides stercoralis TaxID=6248 RepID=A0A0K0E7F1_STRER